MFNLQATLQKLNAINYTDLRQIPNVGGGGSSILLSDTLPGGSLSEDGAGLRINTVTQNAVNGNTKTVSVRIGSSQVAIRNGATDSGGFVQIETYIWRINNSNQYFHCRIVSSAGASPVWVVQNGFITEILSQDLLISLVAIASGAGDITSRLLSIQYLPPGTAVTA